MQNKPDITLVGAGRLAMALAPALHMAGYKISEIVSRNAAASRRTAASLARNVGAHAVTRTEARLDAPIVWFCVADADIAGAAREFAPVTEWRGKIVFHASGAITSDALEPLRRAGAAVASLHPMMTFVRRSSPSLAGVGFAVEGDRSAIRVARSLVRDVKGRIFTISKRAKPLYHAWGAFTSPLLIMELALAEQVARTAGLSPAQARKTMEPIVRRTVDNYFAHGAAAAFSGPLVRGDVETVRRHVRELARVPGAREVYVALARSALRTLPVAKRGAIRKLLQQ